MRTTLSARTATDGPRSVLDLKRPPTPPGEMLLEEYLRPANLTRSAAAERMEIPRNRLNEIIRGRRAITADTAIRLGRFQIVTWGEVIRRLKAAGFVEVRRGKGSHQLFVHPTTKKEAAADTRAKLERAIRDLLAAYLDAHPATVPRARLRVAPVSAGQKSNVHVVAGLVGVGALLGTGRSVHRARASRANGRLGGRPRIADRELAKTARRG